MKAHQREIRDLITTTAYYEKVGHLNTLKEYLDRALFHLDREKMSDKERQWKIDILLRAHEILDESQSGAQYLGGLYEDTRV